MNSYNLRNLFTPDYSDLTGLVKHLNTEELKSILNNDEKLKDIISDLKQVTDIEAEKEMLIAGNKSISEYNLSQKSIMEEYQQSLDSSYRIAVELKDKLLTAKACIESQPAGQSKDTLLALLQAGTSEIEEEAEATVDAFMKKELSVEDFLEKYLELRKLAHLRRIKAEKLSSMIENGSSAIQAPMKPQRLRKPPPPPVPTTTSFPYPNVSPNNNSIANQNIPLAPSRPAPQPPPAPMHRSPYPQSAHMFPTPYPVPQSSNNSPYSLAGKPENFFRSPPARPPFPNAQLVFPSPEDFFRSKPSQGVPHGFQSN